MSARRLDRRNFLTIAGAAGVAAATQSPLARAARDLSPVTGYPFTLGVASGDPSPDGVVLWTRLAPAPLSGGGMPQRRIPVDVEVASDERFSQVVQRGRTMARPEAGHSVHVELTGLEPGREYFFRFRAAGELSPVGRTKTAPAAGAPLAAMNFAFVSCSQYEHGYFTAYGHVAREDVDVVLHLGDVDLLLRQVAVRREVAVLVLRAGHERHGERRGHGAGARSGERTADPRGVAGQPEPVPVLASG